MKKILFTVLLAATNAAHADWVRIDAPFRDPVLYTDHESIKQPIPGRPQVYHIADYAQPQKKDDKEFRSEMFRYEYECEKAVYREMGHTWHKGTMASDKMVAFTEGAWIWSSPEIGSKEAVLMKSVCKAH